MPCAVKTGKVLIMVVVAVEVALPPCLSTSVAVHDTTSSGDTSVGVKVMLVPVPSVVLVVSFFHSYDQLSTPDSSGSEPVPVHVAVVFVVTLAGGKSTAVMTGNWFSMTTEVAFVPVPL